MNTLRISRKFYFVFRKNIKKVMFLELRKEVKSMRTCSQYFHIL